MATYDKDDRVRVTATFTSGGSGTEAGSITASPATLVATQRKPSGADTSLTIDITDKATGVYFVDVDLDQIGTHTVKWKSTENVIATEVAELKVGKSVFDHA
jgi:hypothetical protein